MEQFEIQCPNCKVNIHIPFVRELKAQAIEEADLAEITAREELLGLRLWLGNVSLWSLIKFWFKRVI